MGFFEYDDVIHHSACSVCKGRHRISIVLAISSGQVKTTYLCYVWTPVYLFIYLLLGKQRIRSQFFPIPFSKANGIDT